MNQSSKMQRGRLPDFIVIGATKSGTTSLDHYLSLHPDIHMARPKEPRFFVDLPGGEGHWSRGVNWYASLFVTTKKCCGEVSPQYARFGESNAIPARMASIIPEAKLIYLVREPYERLVSNYLMQFRNGTTVLPFAEFVDGELYSLETSCYGSRLQEFLRYYALDRILVVESKELRDERDACLTRIFSFLGVDPEFRSRRFDREYHTSAENICPDARGRRILRSKPVKFLRRHLSGWTFYHLRNVLMLPFRGEEPPIALPAALEEQIRARLRSEVALLRKLTGQALPSLGP